MKKNTEETAIQSGSFGSPFLHMQLDIYGIINVADLEIGV